jgi:leucyl aminopeptidase
MIGNFDISFGPLDDAKSAISVAFSEPHIAMTPALKALDARSDGLITRAAEIARFHGGKKDFLDLVAPAKLDLDRLLILGLGAPAKYTDVDWLALGGRLRARLSGAKVSAADVLLETATGGPLSADNTALVALGAILRGYEFKKYKM